MNPPALEPIRRPAMVRDQIDQRDRADAEAGELRNALRLIRFQIERYEEGIIDCGECLAEINALILRGLGEEPPPYADTELDAHLDREYDRERER